MHDVIFDICFFFFVMAKSFPVDFFFRRSMLQYAERQHENGVNYANSNNNIVLIILFERQKDETIKSIWF